MKNWTRSSVTSDKNELEIYKVFSDEISNLKKLMQEYIDDKGSENRSLFVLYNNQLMPLSVLFTLKNAIIHNHNLSIEQRAQQSSMLEEVYYRSFEELHNRIIFMAISNPNDVNLKIISNEVSIINSLIRKYLHLIAIQRSGINSISNAKDLKLLEDNIIMRSSDLEQRLKMDNIKRGYR